MLCKGRQIPVQYIDGKKQKGGRPENATQQNAFLKTCSFFENNDEEQLFLSDLIDKMEEFSQDMDFSAYDRCHMKRKLEEFYGDDIIISGGHGNPTIVNKVAILFFEIIISMLMLMLMLNFRKSTYLKLQHNC